MFTQLSFLTKRYNIFLKKYSQRQKFVMNDRSFLTQFLIPFSHMTDNLKLNLFQYRLYIKNSYDLPSILIIITISFP